MKNDISYINKKKHYIGIQILRSILSFHILVFHCTIHSRFKSKLARLLISNVSIDLATFFIISFYFSYKSLNERDIKKIKYRFKRLLIPYIIWPIIFYTYENFILCFPIKQMKYNALYYQFIIGNGVHSVFWFLFNLIFLYLFYTIIIFLGKKQYLFFLLLNGIVSFFFIYYNKFFSKYNYIVAFSTKSLPSSNIYSLIGFYFFSINIDKINMKYKKILYFFFPIIIILCLIYKLYVKFKYFSIFINIFGSISLFFIFLFFPFEIKINNRSTCIIRQITNYTAGIYYLHTKIRDLIKYTIKIKSLTIMQCFVNYLLCYLICFIGFKTFKNYNFKYLFI